MSRRRDIRAQAREALAMWLAASHEQDTNKGRALLESGLRSLADAAGLEWDGMHFREVTAIAGEAGVSAGQLTHLREHGADEVVLRESGVEIALPAPQRTRELSAHLRADDGATDLSLAEAMGFSVDADGEFRPRLREADRSAADDVGLLASLGIDPRDADV